MIRIIPIDGDAIGTVMIIIIPYQHCFIISITMNFHNYGWYLFLEPRFASLLLNILDIVHKSLQRVPGQLEEKRLFDNTDHSIRKYAWVIWLSITIGMFLVHDSPSIIIISLHLGQYTLLFFYDFFVRFQLLQYLLDLYVPGDFVSVLFLASENNCCIVLAGTT